jgi:DNA polymerase I-like protein with 3'-5' exonuclease and polymerase domains
VTAGHFIGLTYEQMMELKQKDPDKFDMVRQLAKAGNFGLLYGMGVDGFFIYAVKNYGVKDLTMEAAGAFREGFFTRYPGLVRYHEQYKRIARETGMVRSPLGRIRHLPLVKSSNRQVASKAERQAINSPVQGCLSDMLCWTMAVEHQRGYTEHCPAFGAIHDASYSYVPEDQVDLWVPKHIECMENLPFEQVGWKPQLKFLADAKIGPSMGELKPWKKS